MTTQTATIRVKKVYPPKSSAAPWNVTVDGAPSTVRYNVWENADLANALAAREGYDAFITWQQGKPYTTKTGITLDQRNIIAFTAPAKTEAKQAVNQPGLNIDRETQIVVQALAKALPSWMAQVDYCDSVQLAQTLDSITLGWRMFLTGRHKQVTPPAKKADEFPFDDEIPFNDE